jgi:hypothetical protein
MPRKMMILPGYGADSGEMGRDLEDNKRRWEID